MWKREIDYYVMDMSAFPEEEEVLLYDGSKFEILDVQNQIKNGQPFNLVVLKCEYYDFDTDN